LSLFDVERRSGNAREARSGAPNQANSALHAPIAETQAKDASIPRIDRHRLARCLLDEPHPKPGG